MQVVFRADASATIGSGHVMRCLTLAEALRAGGAGVLFVCREHEGHLCDLIEGRGFSVKRLAVVRGKDDSDLPYAGWLGASPAQDAIETRHAIEGLGTTPDWLIIDHYGIDESWEQQLRPRVAGIMVIDDLANRRHDCDVLLDQNLVEDLERRYDGILPASCTSLLGPTYALLGRDYIDLHRRAVPRVTPVRRIVISFGGSEIFGLAEMAVRAVLLLDRPDIAIDVVVGASAVSAPRLRELALAHAQIKVHAGLPSLAPLLAAADLAIGAAGTTSWERLCLMVPTIMVTMAPNQLPIAAELQRRGLATYLGESEALDISTLREAIALRLDRPELAEGSVAKVAIDGAGADRVAAVLTGDMPLFGRPATPADEQLLLAWANDPFTRLNGFSEAPIAPETHRQWLAGKLADPGCVLLVVEGRAGPVGQVRFDRDGEHWILSYALAPALRGRGLATSLVRVGMSVLASNAPGATIKALVKPSNVASRRVLERIGFSLAGASDSAAEYRLATIDNHQEG